MLVRETMVNILFVYAMDTEWGEVTDLVASTVLFTMNVAGSIQEGEEHKM